MSTPVTQITRPAPYIEAAGQTLLDLITKQVGQPIQTGAFAPTIAPQNVLQRAAQQQAATQAGLGALSFDATTGAVTGVGQGTGIAGFEPFLQAAQAAASPQAFQTYMSPYQQQVIDTTLSEFDKQRQAQLATLNANAIAQGAFGGGREGVQRAEFGAQTLQDRAALQAQLLQQGFGQAQALANQAFLQQQQLATLQPSLTSGGIQQLGAVGTSDLAYRQSILDAQAQAAREAAYEPFQRLGFFGSALSQAQAGIPANYFTQTSGIQQPTTSPLSQALSTGLTAYGLGSLFGGRR